MQLPRRIEGLCVEVGDELLFYSAKTQRAYALNPVAARVFSRCNGRTDSAELRLDQTVIELALRRFSEQGLLAEPAPSRRRFLAGTLAVLPVVTSLMLPQPASAVSCRIEDGWDMTSVEIQDADCWGGQVSWDICNSNADQPQCGDTSCNNYWIYDGNGNLLDSGTYPALGAKGSSDACHTVTYGPVAPGESYRLVVERACNHPVGGTVMMDADCA